MRESLVSALTIIVFSQVVFAAPPPDELVRKLREAIGDHCPDAKIEMTREGFFAKTGTMQFTVHSRSKTGQVSEKTHQEEGPNYKGFMLRVSLEPGQYGGAASVPQTLQTPYYPTFIDAPATADGQNHYSVHFSYGTRLDPELKKAILETIPRSRLARHEAIPHDR